MYTVINRTINGFFHSFTGLRLPVGRGGVALTAQVPNTFSNPAFQSQDPWIVQWQGDYFYSDTEHNTIRIRKSSTLTGLSTATPQIVWTNSGTGLHNVWAPEIHILDGRWYLYFSADRGDKRQRMYVQQGGSDPLGTYTNGNTGVPDGMLAESGGKWAIDPDVFYGPDHNLYLVWSCSDDPFGAAPQSLCLAGMRDPLHIATSTVRISQPDRRLGTSHGRHTGRSGRIRAERLHVSDLFGKRQLDARRLRCRLARQTPAGIFSIPAAWVKSGPIFDRHGKTYGPGSVAFVLSPDGTETWNVYHAYDRLNCAAWGCRSVRFQKVAWSADGLPLLGYPVDPSVAALHAIGRHGFANRMG